MIRSLRATLTRILKPHRAASPVKGGGRLLRRTFVVALIMVSGGLITAGGVELVFRYQESVDSIGRLQREMAEGAAFKIQQYVRDIEKTMRAASHTPENISTGLTQAFRFHLLKMMRVTPAITTVVAMDAEGAEIVRASRIAMAGAEGAQAGQADAAYSTAREGKSYFSPVYFVRKSEPYMQIAVPIEWFAGQVEGVLIAEVNLKYIWDVISDVRVGTTGYAYVVSDEGDLIAHPDISLVLQKRSVSHLDQVQAALSGSQEPISVHPNLAGESVFPTYAAIPDLGWAVLVERPVKEAYAPLYASILRTFLLLLVGLAMAILASLLIGRRIVRPIEVLRQGAARIGEGELAHRITIRTGDELEALADEFNHMAAQLQEERAGLEQAVEERTQELGDALQRQTAVAEILDVINTSPTDMTPVFDAILSKSLRLCDAGLGIMLLWRDNTWKLVAHQGDVGTEMLEFFRKPYTNVGPQDSLARVMNTLAPVQLENIEETEAYRQGHPMRVAAVEAGIRVGLIVPIRKEASLQGVICVYRGEAAPFSEKQIDLVQTFADQAAIAMDNVNLLQALQHRTEELEIASKHKSQFLANMSHELRTPMNAILGYTELILDEIYGSVPEKVTEVLNRVSISGKHLLGLINDVLDLAKIEAGQIKLAVDDYSMKNLVQNVVVAIESLAAEKSLELDVRVPDDLPVGRGDEQRLTQVLLNLAGNAIKFCEEGRVGLEVMAENGEFIVSVSDTGPGIAEDEQERIFEEFQQADSSSTKKKGGTGLGLAIAKRFVEMHGGRLWVESLVGEGSTFRFAVPVNVDQ